MGFCVFFTDDMSDYYDFDKYALYISDQEILITGNSKIIFDYLIENQGIPKTPAQIYSQINGVVVPIDMPKAPVSSAVKVLRKKLGKYGKYIETVRGVGYRYVGPPKMKAAKSRKTDLSMETSEKPKADFPMKTTEGHKTVSRLYFDDKNSDYYDLEYCLHISDRDILLTGNSKKIFDYLIENRNIAKSCEQIYSQIADGEQMIGTFKPAIIEAVKSLRKKLGIYGKCIETVRGMGYKYVGPPKYVCN